MTNLWTPNSDDTAEAKHRCMCGAEFPKGHISGFHAHIRECVNEKQAQMMDVHEKRQKDGFQTGFDKEKIKFARDRGHL